MKIVKPYMKIENLTKAGAAKVAVLTRNLNLIESIVDQTTPKADLTRDGFYFLVNSDNIVVARYYVGRQRSKAGFAHVITKMKREVTSTNTKIKESFQLYDVLYLPTSAMKPVTTGVNKGPVALLLTRQHNDRFQNLEEMNRMLNDNFKFLYQKY